MPTTEENVQQILKQYCDSNNSLDETLLKGFMTKYFEEIGSLFDKQQSRTLFSQTEQIISSCREKMEDYCRNNPYEGNRDSEQFLSDFATQGESQSEVGEDNKRTITNATSEYVYEDSSSIMTEEFSQYYQKFSEELTRTVLLESKGAIASLAAFEGRADDSKYIIGKIAGRPGEKSLADSVFEEYLMNEVRHARNDVANSAYSQIDEVNGASGINTVSAALSFDDIIALVEKRGITNTQFDNMGENISGKEDRKYNKPIDFDNPFV